MAPYPTETYLTSFRNDEPGTTIALEFDHLYAQMQGYLSKEHNPDGTHKDVLTMGVPVDVPWDAANFSGGAGTWTVAEADQSVFQYTRNGRWVRFGITLRATTVSGTTATLSVTLPFRAGSKVDTYGKTLDNLTDKTVFIVVNEGSRTMALTLAGGANWTASTNQTYIYAYFDLYLAS